MTTKPMDRALFDEIQVEIEKVIEKYGIRHTVLVLAASVNKKNTRDDRVLLSLEDKLIDSLHKYDKIMLLDDDEED